MALNYADLKQPVFNIIIFLLVENVETIEEAKELATTGEDGKAEIPDLSAVLYERHLNPRRKAKHKHVGCGVADQVGLRRTKRCFALLLGGNGALV